MNKKHYVIEAKGFPKYYEQIKHKHCKPKMKTIKGEFPLSNEPKEKKKSKRFLCKLGFHSRIVFSQDGWNFMFCVHCQKKWHEIDI